MTALSCFSRVFTAFLVSILPVRGSGEPRQAQENYLAPPDEIKIKGTHLSDTISTALGRVQLRGARSTERLFGRTPNRAVAEATQTVSRVLHRAGWPSSVSSLNAEWKIVFLDENLPETQIPFYLISSCHPGWMTPPANIYVIAQRIAAGCGGSTKLRIGDADAEMMLVLLHELGHVVEFHLLGQKQTTDRAQAEGFATWFEYFASASSELTRRGERRKIIGAAIERASKSWAPGEAVFSATMDGYSAAACPFAAVFAKRGVRGIGQVYKALMEGSPSLEAAIRAATGWNPARLKSEVNSLLLD